MHAYSLRVALLFALPAPSQCNVPHTDDARLPISIAIDPICKWNMSSRHCPLTLTFNCCPICASLNFTGAVSVFISVGSCKLLTSSNTIASCNSFGSNVTVILRITKDCPTSTYVGKNFKTSYQLDKSVVNAHSN